MVILKLFKVSSDYSSSQHKNSQYAIYTVAGKNSR